MTRFKKLTIWVIILDLLIVIAAGHGVGFLGLIEIFWFPQFYGIGKEDFFVLLTSSFDKILGFVAFISLVGQLLLVASLVVKQQVLIFCTKLLGLILMLTGYFCLSYSFFHSDISKISFVTGLPFLSGSLILCYRLIKQKLETKLSG